LLRIEAHAKGEHGLLLLRRNVLYRCAHGLPEGEDVNEPIWLSTAIIGCVANNVRSVASNASHDRQLAHPTLAQANDPGSSFATVVLVRIVSAGAPASSGMVTFAICLSITSAA